MPDLNNNAVVRAYQSESLECRDGERAVIARVNTGEVDRYRTVIDPAGINLSAYQKNPVVLWEHGRGPQGSVPVARCQWIKYDRSNNCLVAKAIFGTDPFADQIFRMYQDRTLNAFSVNILPDEMSPPTKEERATKPDLTKCEMIYRKSELAEFSAVSVPGNANALAIEVSRGLWVPEEIRAKLPKPQDDDGDDDEAEDAEENKEQEEEEDAEESRDMGSDDDGGEEECFDGSTLRCTERHEMGHCPRCGERCMAGGKEDCLRCMKGHEFAASRAIACPFKDAERASLPPLTGKPFGEVYAGLVMQIRSWKASTLKQIKEEIDLMKGRV